MSNLIEFCVETCISSPRYLVMYYANIPKSPQYAKSEIMLVPIFQIMGNQPTYNPFQYES